VISPARLIFSSSDSSLTARSAYDPPPRDELEAAGAQDLPRGIADRVGLEADRAVEQLGQRADERALRLDELDALDCPRGLGVAEVGEEPHALGLDEQRGVRAGEADEVAHVDAVGDEQRLLEARAQAVDPAHRASTARYCSASW